MSKRGILILAGVLLMAVSFCTPALAQFGSIEGDVKGEDGNALQGALIVIDRTDIKGSYKVKTDKKGHYFHGGLPLGAYTVTLMVGEQKRDLVQGVRTRLGDATVINFDLKAAKDRALAAQLGIKTGGQQGRGGGQQGEAPQLTKEQREQIEKQLKSREMAREKMEKLNKHFADGVAALQAKNFDTAITELEAATQIDATQHVVFAQLAEAYAGSARAKRGQESTALYKKANDAYEKAIALKPDEASYHNNYGLALANAGNIPEAQAEFGKAAQLNPPGAGRYYFNLGAVLTNNGRIKEAAEAFKKATEADPSYAEAWYQFGVSLSAEAKFDEKTGKITAPPGMLEALQKYLDLQPTGPYADGAKSLIQSMAGTVQTEIKKARKR